MYCRFTETLFLALLTTEFEREELGLIFVRAVSSSTLSLEGPWPLESFGFWKLRFLRALACASLASTSFLASLERTLGSAGLCSAGCGLSALRPEGLLRWAWILSSRGASSALLPGLSERRSRSFGCWPVRGSMSLLESCSLAEAGLASLRTELESSLTRSA